MTCWLEKVSSSRFLPETARQSPLEDAQKLFRFLLGHHAQRLVELRNDLPLLIDITAANVGDVALFRFEPAAQLGNFFFVHVVFLFLIALAQPALPQQAPGCGVSIIVQPLYRIFPWMTSGSAAAKKESGQTIDAASSLCYAVVS